MNFRLTKDSIDTKSPQPTFPPTYASSLEKSKASGLEQEKQITEKMARYIRRRSRLQRKQKSKSTIAFKRDPRRFTNPYKTTIKRTTNPSKEQHNQQTRSTRRRFNRRNTAAVRFTRNPFPHHKSFNLDPDKVEKSASYFSSISPALKNETAHQFSTTTKFMRSGAGTNRDVERSMSRAQNVKLAKLLDSMRREVSELDSWKLFNKYGRDTDFNLNKPPSKKSRDLKNASPKGSLSMETFRVMFEDKNDKTRELRVEKEKQKMKRMFGMKSRSKANTIKSGYNQSQASETRVPQQVQRMTKLIKISNLSIEERDKFNIQLLKNVVARKWAEVNRARAAGLGEGDQFDETLGGSFYRTRSDFGGALPRIDKAVRRPRGVSFEDQQGTLRMSKSFDHRKTDQTGQKFGLKQLELKSVLKQPKALNLDQIKLGDSTTENQTLETPMSPPEQPPTMNLIPSAQRDEETRSERISARLREIAERNMQKMGVSSSSAFYRVQKDLYMKIFKEKLKGFKFLRRTLDKEKIRKANVFTNSNPKLDKIEQQVKNKVVNLSEIKYYEDVLKNYYHSLADLNSNLVEVHKYKHGIKNDLTALGNTIARDRVKRAREIIENRTKVRAREIIENRTKVRASDKRRRGFIAVDKTVNEIEKLGRSVEKMKELKKVTGRGSPRPDPQKSRVEILIQDQVILNTMNLKDELKNQFYLSKERQQDVLQEIEDLQSKIDYTSSKLITYYKNILCSPSNLLRLKIPITKILIKLDSLNAQVESSDFPESFDDEFVTYCYKLKDLKTEITSFFHKSRKNFFKQNLKPIKLTPNLIPSEILKSSSIKNTPLMTNILRKMDIMTFSGQRGQNFDGIRETMHPIFEESKSSYSQTNDQQSEMDRLQSPRASEKTQSIDPAKTNFRKLRSTQSKGVRLATNTKEGLATLKSGVGGKDHSVSKISHILGKGGRVGTTKNSPSSSGLNDNQRQLIIGMPGEIENLKEKEIERIFDKYCRIFLSKREVFDMFMMLKFIVGTAQGYNKAKKVLFLKYIAERMENKRKQKGLTKMSVSNASSREYNEFLDFLKELKEDEFLEKEYTFL